MSKKTALVTGANRGIGKAIVAGLVQNSDLHLRVLLGSRDVKKGMEAAKDLPDGVEVVAIDVGSRDALKEQVREIEASFGPVDILVNNAGILHRGEILEAEEEGFDETLRVNVTGPFDLIRLVLPGMKERGFGRIVNVSSGWGSFNEGLEGPVSYAVSKAALNALTVAAARNLPANVKVNSMCPGWVRTDMGGMDAARSPEEGADTAIWLATLNDDGPSGGFFRDRKPIGW